MTNNTNALLLCKFCILLLCCQYLMASCDVHVQFNVLNCRLPLPNGQVYCQHASTSTLTLAHRQVALHGGILLKTNLFKIPALHFALNGSSVENDFKIPSLHFAWDDFKIPALHFMWNGSSLESNFKIPALHSAWNGSS